MPPRTLLACLLALTATLAAADTPQPSTKTPVRGFDWMNARRDPKGGFYETGQLTRPVGKITDLSGRILDLAWTPGQALLVVKTTHVVATLDPATLKVLHSLGYPDREGGSMHGIAMQSDGNAWVTSGTNSILELRVTKDGKLAWGRKIAVGEQGKSNPLGLALEPGDTVAWVALAIENTLARVDLVTGKVTARVAVGICPYGVARSADGRRVFVSNFGGRRAGAGDMTELSAGTAVPVDARSVALNGVVSVVDTTGTPREIAQIGVGLHPTSLLLDGTTLYVSNVGGDSVSVIDTASGRVIRTLDTRPDKDLPWGSLPDGLALSPDRLTLHVGLAGLNAVASLDLQNPDAAPALTPTGWYPGVVTRRGDVLYVALARAGVQQIPPARDATERTGRDSLAREAARTAHAVAANQLSVGSQARPVPVPAKPGDPSVIKHVVYIIKENRTYDQVLGDLGRGNGDPSLCLFPRNVTPNHHALAETFVLLDNYYCNGVNSADGHMWATQGITTPYREKDRNGYRCAYDFGTDALCYAGCGFLWDQALLAGRTFRNYGELDYTVKLRGKTYDDFYQDWKNRTGKTAYQVHFGIEALRRMGCPDYPGWEMSIPDQVRADVFLRELAEFSRKGALPQLIILYLPNDHTASELTPSSYLADNDLALGRIIEGLSRSPFWKDTVVFVNEDDPQTGGDHVDGHRSLCLVASPWAKRGVTLSRFYNQTAVLHTICRILGLRPLNQLVAAAPTMEDCFQDTPDLTPYSAHHPAYPLNERRPAGKKTSQLSIDEQAAVARADRLDFSAPDRIDDDTLNRSIWAQTRPGERYPVEFMGAHGKGLAALGLKLDTTLEDDEDDER